MVCSPVLCPSLLNAVAFGMPVSTPHPPQGPKQVLVGMGRAGKPDVGEQHQRGGLWARGRRLRKVGALSWEPREGKREADSSHPDQPASAFSPGVQWALGKPDPLCASGPGLVSSGCCSKSPQTAWFKVRQACTPSAGSKGDPSPPPTPRPLEATRG